jgi:hypothetical protein
MRTISIMLAVIILFSMAGCGPSVTGISGEIKNAATQEKLEGVNVALAKCTGENCVDFKFNNTDKDGIYAFTDLGGGKYQVTVTWKSKVDCGLSGFQSFKQTNGFLVVYAVDNFTGRTTAIATRSVDYQPGQKTGMNLAIECPGAKK